MANRQFYYFYAPTWDFAPDGPIKLGNILTSLKKPHVRLANIPPLQDMGVSATEKKRVQYTEEKLRSGCFSIFTKFLSPLGFGVDVGTQVEFSNKQSFTFDTLETSEFMPTAEYLRHCIEQEPVRRWLELKKYRKPIYVITGLKIVAGAEVHTIKSRTVGGTLSVQVDGAIWSGGSVPISSGPGIEQKVSRNQEAKWEGGNFVFAFRVSKVRVKKSGDIASEKEVTSGAFLDRHNAQSIKTPLDLMTVESPTPESEGLHGVRLMEGNEVVCVAMPREED